MEKILLAVVALQLVFLPWALGAMHVWAQLTSLVLSCIAFAIALAGPDNPRAQLLHFPLFWAGLVVIAYVFIQALNPAWRYERDATSWWLAPAQPIPWLPAGIDAPLSLSNAWRSAIVLGSLWLLLCSAWTGLVHRRSIRSLLVVLSLNGFLLALLGIAQDFTGSKKIFWSYLPANDAFAASFIYRNHGAAYLNLIVALGTGLALWFFERKLRSREKSGPAGIFAVFAVLAALMVVLSASRTSILLLLVFCGTLIGILTLRVATAKNRPRRTAEIAVLTLLLAAFAGTAVATLQTGKVRQRFDTLAADLAGTARHRTLAREAATDMLRDRWLLGWGAGGFRHGFPLYASRYPAIYDSEVTGRRKFWEHAHNDLIQFPLELGLAGMLPVVAGLGWCGWQLFQLRFWKNVIALPVVLGCGLLFAHATVDFVFQCPAILLTSGVLLLASIRLLELDPPRA